MNNKQQINPFLIYKEELKEIVLLRFDSHMDFMDFISRQEDKYLHNVIALVDNEFEGDKRYIFTNIWTQIWDENDESQSNEDFMLNCINAVHKNNKVVISNYNSYVEMMNKEGIDKNE